MSFNFLYSSNIIEEVYKSDMKFVIIVNVDVVEDLFEKNISFRNLFRTNELQYAANRGNSWERIGACLAAKLAFYNMYSDCNCNFIEIFSKENKNPYIIYKGLVCASVHLSMTHVPKYAAAALWKNTRGDI